MTTQNNEQESIVIPDWFRRVCTILGTVLVVGSIISIFLFIINKEYFPSPTDLEAKFLLALGVVLLLILYVPWQRINIAGIEVERAVQELTQDFVAENKKSNADIEELNAELLRLRKKAGEESSPAKIAAVSLTDEGVEELVLKFLQKWARWGFSVSRVRNWGGEQAGFEELRNLETSSIRGVLGKLESANKVRTRISKTGNILYQAV